MILAICVLAIAARAVGEGASNHSNSKQEKRDILVLFPANKGQNRDNLQGSGTQSLLQVNTVPQNVPLPVHIPINRPVPISIPAAYPLSILRAFPVPVHRPVPVTLFTQYPAAVHRPIPVSQPNNVPANVGAPHHAIFPVHQSVNVQTPQHAINNGNVGDIVQNSAFGSGYLPQYHNSRPHDATGFSDTTKLEGSGYASNSPTNGQYPSGSSSTANEQSSGYGTKASSSDNSATTAGHVSGSDSVSSGHSSEHGTVSTEHKSSFNSGLTSGPPSVPAGQLDYTSGSDAGVQHNSGLASGSGIGSLRYEPNLNSESASVSLQQTESAGHTSSFNQGLQSVPAAQPAGYTQGAAVVPTGHIFSNLNSAAAIGSGTQNSGYTAGSGPLPLGHISNLNLGSGNVFVGGNSGSNILPGYSGYGSTTTGQHSGSVTASSGHNPGLVSGSKYISTGSGSEKTLGYDILVVHGSGHSTAHTPGFVSGSQPVGQSSNTNTANAQSVGHSSGSNPVAVYHPGSGYNLGSINHGFVSVGNSGYNTGQIASNTLVSTKQSSESPQINSGFLPQNYNPNYNLGTGGITTGHHIIYTSGSATLGQNKYISNGVASAGHNVNYPTTSNPGTDYGTKLVGQNLESTAGFNSISEATSNQQNAASNAVLKTQAQKSTYTSELRGNQNAILYSTESDRTEHASVHSTAPSDTRHASVQSSGSTGSGYTSVHSTGILDNGHTSGHSTESADSGHTSAYSPESVDTGHTTVQSSGSTGHASIYVGSGDTGHTYVHSTGPVNTPYHSVHSGGIVDTGRASVHSLGPVAGEKSYAYSSETGSDSTLNSEIRRMSDSRESDFKQDIGTSDYDRGYSIASGQISEHTSGSDSFATTHKPGMDYPTTDKYGEYNVRSGQFSVNPGQSHVTEFDGTRDGQKSDYSSTTGSQQNSESRSVSIMKNSLYNSGSSSYRSEAAARREQDYDYLSETNPENKSVFQDSVSSHNSGHAYNRVHNSGTSIGKVDRNSGYGIVGNVKANTASVGHNLASKDNIQFTQNSGSEQSTDHNSGSNTAGNQREKVHGLGYSTESSPHLEISTSQELNHRHDSHASNSNYKHNSGNIHTGIEYKTAQNIDVAYGSGSSLKEKHLKDSSTSVSEETLLSDLRHELLSLYNDVLSRQG
ncbi:sericin 1-like [Periplaneta americana]|uniref:sericin 1-like n=1 Tax=Periplaneta americana TaxID=6978 RepID=UPI0037E7CEB2